MGNQVNGSLLERVRKLLVKAEAEGVTQAEAEALTAKASELMARHGIESAMLAAAGQVQDTVTGKMFVLQNPWARVQAHLLSHIAKAMRGSAVYPPSQPNGSIRVHVMAFGSDMERIEVMLTSLMLQMFRDHRRAQATDMPPHMRSPRAWNRSYLLGWVSAAASRLKAAEGAAVQEAAATGAGTELVLADRSHLVQARLHQEYPKIRTVKTTYTGGGYGAGHRDGQRADLGRGGVDGRGRGAIAAG